MHSRRTYRRRSVREGPRGEYGGTAFLCRPRTRLERNPDGVGGNANEAGREARPHHRPCGVPEDRVCREWSAGQD